MRAVIRARLSAGASDQQILDEFVASYGDSILSEPPKRGISLGVWLGPTIGVVLGSVLLVTVLRAWRRAPRPVATTAVASGLDGDLDREVVDEFSRFRQEVGP
jgi:cytochrome c-type biogenesis protein CcmH